jgi:serpin B
MVEQIMHSRKKFLFVFFCIVGCITLLSNTYTTADEEANMKSLADGNNTFALDLYAHLSGEEKNLFFSPYSISTALAMTYAGARGKTEQQMAEVLHFTLDQESLHPAFANLADHFREIQKKGDIALSIANALWIQEDFELLKPFLTITKQYYEAKPFQVNFKEAYEDIRIEINKWVEKQTKEKIKDLLPQGVLSELTRLVLTNAIYFKGNWALQFEKELTQDESFWITPDKEIVTPMMHQEASFKYGEADSLQVLEMPYAGEDLSMIVLLPGEKDGLSELERKLNSENITTWTSESSYQEVDVYVPKFTMTSQFTLSAILKAMGMEDAFSGNADFSGIESSKQLNITDVIHKAFVEVNEEGTEAAAATGVVVGLTSVSEPQPVPIFKADHPFVFFIRDNHSESILFLGRVVNPSD